MSISCTMLNSHLRQLRWICILLEYTFLCNFLHKFLSLKKKGADSGNSLFTISDPGCVGDARKWRKIAHDSSTVINSSMKNGP